MLNRRFFTGTLVGRFSRTHPFICGPFWTVVRGVLAASPRRRPCPPYSRTFLLWLWPELSGGADAPALGCQEDVSRASPPAKAHRPPPQRPLLPIPALPKTSGLKLQRTIVVNAALIPKMLPK